MKQVLNKFVTTEGVLGAYVLNPEHAVFESDMPARFSDESLHQIGGHLERIAGLARSDFSDPAGISFCFESAILRIQDFNDGYHFIALLSPEMNRGVLDEATDTFINEFTRAIAASPPLPSVKSSDDDPVRKTLAEPVDVLSPEDLVNSDTLAGPLDTMQSALAKVLGPIAKMVLFDALEKWSTLDTPCMDSLPMLTDIVAEEIGDADLVNGFKERLPSFCCSPSPDLSSVKKRKIKKT